MPLVQAASCSRGLLSDGAPARSLRLRSSERLAAAAVCAGRDTTAARAGSSGAPPRLKRRPVAMHPSIAGRAGSHSREARQEPRRQWSRARSAQPQCLLLPFLLGRVAESRCLGHARRPRRCRPPPEPPARGNGNSCLHVPVGPRLCPEVARSPCGDRIPIPLGPESRLVGECPGPASDGQISPGKSTENPSIACVGVLGQPPPAEQNMRMTERSILRVTETNRT